MPDPTPREWGRLTAADVLAHAPETVRTVRDSIWTPAPRIDGYAPYWVARNGRTATFYYRRNPHG